MQVDNATNVSVSYSPEFFNSQDFRFGTRRLTTFQCWDGDVTNSEGVAASLEDIKLLYKEKIFTNWLVNGYSFENATLSSFNIDDGDWVPGVGYSFSLIQYLGDADGNASVIDSPGGDYYKGIDFRGKAQYLEDFSENFSFNAAANSTSYSHSVTFKFSKSINEGKVSKEGGIANSQIAFAKEIAEQLLLGDYSDRPPFGFDDYPMIKDVYEDLGPNYIRHVTEVYDLSNKSVTFTERFDTLTKDLFAGSNPAYFISRNHLIKMGEDGIVEITENSELDYARTGLVSGGKKAQQELERVTEDEIEAGRARLQLVWDGYKSIISASFDQPSWCDLEDLVLDDDGLPTLITNSQKYNEPAQKMSYTIVGTNDPEQGKVRHEYRLTFSRVGLFFQLTEDGFMQGNDVKIRVKQGTAGKFGQWDREYPAYNDAYAFYFNDFLPEVDNRMLTEFQSKLGPINTNVSAKSPPTKISEKYIKNEESFSQTQGRITYTKTYSNEPKYNWMDKNVKSVEVNVSKNEKTERKAEEALVDSITLLEDSPGNTILQSREDKESKEPHYSLPQKVNQVNIIGYRDVTLQEMLEVAVDALDPGEIYLEDCSYQGGDYNETFLNLSASWR